MSDRTWLGPGEMVWADYNLSEFGSIAGIAKAAAWQMPHKVIAATPELMMEFLEECSIVHEMHPDDFWIVGLEGRVDFVEHPSWEEVERYLGIPRGRVQ